LLAYRSSKSVRPDRRALIKECELKTNQLLEDCVRACIDGGYMRPVDEYLLVYQYTMFCHAWALKHWAFKGRYTLGQYVAGCIRTQVEPLLTEKGLADLVALRARTADFAYEPYTKH
jgi:hypothetical protein